jgi:hypothetical protein
MGAYSGHYSNASIEYIKISHVHLTIGIATHFVEHIHTHLYTMMGMAMNKGANTRLSTITFP